MPEGGDAMQNVLRRRAMAGVLGLMLAAGCGPHGPPRAAVEGTVTRGGRPVPQGRVLFRPQPPAQGPMAAAAIVNGRFQLDRKEGPVVGPNQVEIVIEPSLGFALDDEAAYARHRGRVQPVVLRVQPPGAAVVEVALGKVNRFDWSLPGAGTGGEATR
jgi:hypothetical protein